MKRLLLLLLLSSCQRHGHWHHQNIPAKEIDHCSRLLYRSEDPIGGIDLEWLQTKETLTTYLQVHFGSIHASDESGPKAKVIFSTSEKTVSFLIDFHEGEQRLRLLPAQQTALLTLLEEGQPVTIDLEGFHETIDPSAFAPFLKKLKTPPYKLPFHLPI